MGATDFNTVSLGRDAQSAFNNAVQSARHEYGHGGYTGTIAEKHQFVAVECPARVTTDKLAGWIEGWEDAGKVPAKHRPLVERLQRVYEDKWGAAVCLIPGPSEQARLRKEAGIKSREKFFRFVGIASC